MAVALSMSNNIKVITWFLFFLFFLTACSAEKSEPTVQAEIHPLSFEQWSLQLKNYKNNILVVDLWAMWCVSCIERFPEMVKLHNKYKEKSVHFISMNLDDRNDLKSISAAQNFLTEMNANFDHFRMDENILEAFEYLNLISIPAVFIYDKHGEEKYRLTGDNPNQQFSEKDIELAIKSLLQTS